MVGSAFSSLTTTCSSARARHFLSLSGVVLILALAGCGGDDEKPAAATTPATTEPAATVPTETAATTQTAPDVPSKTVTSQEDKPGGAGDEEPAAAQALITGEGGKLSPLRIQVPPFIAVKVVLESADGVEYMLEDSKGKQIKSGGEIRSASATFPGMKTGERLVLKGPQGDILIEASAEPGP